MRKRQLEVLQKLISTPSPSGFEERISKLIRTELVKYLPRTHVTIDFHNNVIATVDGKDTTKSIVIDAHLDQIGFAVTNVNREGLISMGYLGGGDYTILTARQLTILTDKGDINAVIDRKHAHLVTDEDEEAIENIEDAQIDIGVRKRRQVQRHVKIGDPIVYKPHFYNLTEDYYAGYGFDDKAGCWVLIDTIKEISKLKKKPPVNLIFVFSSQEETGSKLHPVVEKYRPDLTISLDVTFATDYGWGDEMDRQAGLCELGKGVVIYKGLDIHKPSASLLENIARKHKVKFQNQANVDAGGFTALMVSDKGTRACVLGIPLRNMHTPVETVCLKDLTYSSRLLKNFLMSENIKRTLEK
jgi:endoglucanase